MIKSAKRIETNETEDKGKRINTMLTMMHTITKLQTSWTVNTINYNYLRM